MLSGFMLRKYFEINSIMLVFHYEVIQSPSYLSKDEKEKKKHQKKTIEKKSWRVALTANE